LQLLVVRLGLFGLGFKYSPKILWRKDDFKGVLRQLPPRSLDQGIDQVNSIVEVNRAQALGVGPVSWYNFALTLHYVPIILIGNSISTAAFPRLTERLSQGRPDLFRRDFRMVLRVLVWITLPVVVVGYFARGYLARLIFGDVAPEVSLIFGFLTIAILFRIIYSMFSRYFYAHKDTITPLLVSIFAIGLNIYLAFKLTRPESYGITGLALAQSIVAASEVVILFIFMIYKDHKVFADKSFWGALLKTFSVTGFSVLTAFIMVSLLPLKISDRGFVTLGVKFGAIAGVTLLVHLVMSLLFGLKEPRPVLQKLRRLIVKPIKI
jgi:putative peptidoglycan lipid II flippase